LFDLLGNKETGLTKSLGYAFANSHILSERFLDRYLAVPGTPLRAVRLELVDSAAGRTDLELVGDDFHVIIEAKRDWALASELQFHLYRNRFHPVAERLFVSLSAWSPSYAERTLPPRIQSDSGPVAVRHCSWRLLRDLAVGSGVRGRERALLDQFRRFLSGVIAMQDQNSNAVLVVPLGNETTRRMLETDRVYFHPAGPNGLKEPPNYIAFCYRGRLQSIHHVAGAHIVVRKSESPALRDIDGVKDFDRPHFVFKLDPPMRRDPEHVLETGNVLKLGGRRRCLLHTLFTCDTLADARCLEVVAERRDGRT
jgi:hypothetical protein